MSDYTKFKRGSEWRMWDLHIHTPDTNKNDQFTGINSDEKWENYATSINQSVEDISVIGITDYFSIDNYFKFKDLHNRGKITKHFDLIIPNIELRVLPATSSATAINIHCLFNPSLEKEIDNRFLAKLAFQHRGSNYSAARTELIRFGRVLRSNSLLDEKAAIKAGVEQLVISYDTLRLLFEKDSELRDDTIIVVSNSGGDGVSGIVKHEDFFIDNGSQLDATRQSIYQFSDAIFSSNKGDRRYFIGQGPDKKEIVIQKCGALMPCYHGCDAHSNSKIFKPDDNRYCWIKADPTFEGLRQTLYEPEDRVRIQAMKPDIKNERFIISDLTFIDSTNLFGNQKILLNENLNSIIGGKSSGKSLLLYSTADSIDPEQVARASKRLSFEGYKFDSIYDFEVTWKNDQKDRLNDKNSNNKIHGITYIPQLYINYLVERNNKEELNILIKNILLQDEAFKTFHTETQDSISKTTVEIDRLVTNYFQTRKKALDLQQRIKEIGKSATIVNGIQQIQASIDAGQKASTLDSMQFDEYNRLATSKAVIEKDLQELNLKEVVLNKIIAEVKSNQTQLFGTVASDRIVNLKGQIDRILDELTSISPDVSQIRDQLFADYNKMLINLENEVNNLNVPASRQSLKAGVDKVNNDLKPYLGKLAGQEELKKLIAQLEAERQKKELSENLEKQLTAAVKDYSDIRLQTATLLKFRYDLQKSIAEKVNTTKNDIGSEIKLNAQLLFKEEELPLFNQVNKSAISKENVFNTIFQNKYVSYDELLKIFLNPLRVADDKLMITNEVFIPLKINTDFETIIRGLVADHFEVDYTVTYKSDNLLTMSPGKKGTVLLILFLQISSAEYPILIDQPEDNLDNRTIYELLCQMIKVKKKDRQIIIVSHNANLVVATDSENIIVANQEGQVPDSNTSQYRFEYVNGSLELSFKKADRSKGILQEQGIKEHVCDILEGGGEAFKQRERKYSIK